MVEISTYDDATTSKDHLCLIESIEDEEGDPTGNNKLAQGNHSKVVKNDEPSKVSNVFNVIRRSLRTVRGKRTTNVARSSKYIYKNEVRY
jgi:hypothetical protein